MIDPSQASYSCRFVVCAAIMRTSEMFTVSAPQPVPKHVIMGKLH